VLALTYRATVDAKADDAADPNCYSRNAMATENDLLQHPAELLSKGRHGGTVKFETCINELIADRSIWSSWSNRCS
jgi:hypothetical protein